MTRTSSLEVSIKTHIDCILNISTIILTVLCVYITAPPVNYSILCISSIVPIVAFVNLLLKKMVVWWMSVCNSHRGRLSLIPSVGP